MYSGTTTGGIQNVYRRSKLSFGKVGIAQYEPLIIYAILDMARRMAIKRMVEDAILLAMPKGKSGIVNEWLTAFEVTNAGSLLWVEEEILMIIRNIKLTSNCLLEFDWLDGSMTEYKLPRYAPAKGILDNDIG